MLSLLPSIRRSLMQKRRACVSGVVNGSGLARLIQQTTCIRHLSVKAAAVKDNSSFFAALAKKISHSDEAFDQETHKWSHTRLIPAFKSHTFEDGSKYEGEWLNGKMQGKGKLFTPAGAVFEGKFDKGHPIDGNGVLVLKNGELYHGAFVGGKRHGPVRIEYPFAGVKECRYQHGERVGPVEYTYTDGAEYEGGMVGNRKHGQGRLVDARGQILEGEFADGKIVNGHGFLQLKDGGFYFGGFKDGERHGKGRLTNMDGETVQGEFRNNKLFNGEGVLANPDGSVFKGTWVEGNWHGQGKLTFRDGRSYEGTFNEGKVADGSGVMELPNGSVFEGTWVDGRWTGQGKLTHADGQSLQGEFRDGKLYTGEGCIQFTNGDVYVGQMVAGQRHGPGVFTFVSGKVKRGEWRDNKLNDGKLNNSEETSNIDLCATAVAPEASVVFPMTGKETVVPPASLAETAETVHSGVISFTNKQGMRYEGVYLDEAKKHGQGRITYTDGSSYEGEWVKERRHGQGKLTSAAGDVFEGVFERDAPVSGRGVLPMKDGGRYEGELVQGKRHGQARVTSASGDVLQIHYEVGIPASTATYTYQDGSVYTGGWNSEPHGKGVLRLPSGEEKVGEWVRGVFRTEIAARAEAPVRSRVAAVDIAGTVEEPTMAVDAHTVLRAIDEVWTPPVVKSVQAGQVIVTMTDYRMGVVTFPNGSVYQGAILHNWPEGEGRLTYMSGEIQVGTFKRGKIWTGEGTMHLKDGSVYEGCVQEGKWEGQGKLTQTNGSMVEGVFKTNRIFNGTGRLLLSNGALFEGSWLEGKKHGPGKLTSADGHVLTGEFREGSVFNGEGAMVTADGKVWEGRWKNFIFSSWKTLRMKAKQSPVKAAPIDSQNVHMEAKPEVVPESMPEIVAASETVMLPSRTYSNGMVYVGEMEGGRRHGQGKLTSAAGDVFEGVFERDAPVSGWGVLPMKDGGRYEGELVQGKRHGQGKLTLGDGCVKEGRFREGKLYEGTVTCSNYIESWVGGVRVKIVKVAPAQAPTADSPVVSADSSTRTADVSPQRLPTRTKIATTSTTTTTTTSTSNVPAKFSFRALPFPGDSTYVGELHKGKKHGQGKVAYVDGRTLEGEFQEGKLWNGRGVMMFPNGDVYDGEWADGLKHGHGKLTVHDGRVYEGQFRKGQLYAGTMTHKNHFESWEGGTRVSKLNPVDAAPVASSAVAVSSAPAPTTSADAHELINNGELHEDETHGESVSDKLSSRTYANGMVYVGEMEGGRRHGQGKLTSAAGVFEGIFEQDAPVSGRGVLPMKDGGRYEGELLQGKRHGQGKLTLGDGRVLEGAFKEGKLHAGSVTRNNEVESWVGGMQVPTQNLSEAEDPVAPAVAFASPVEHSTHSGKKQSHGRITYTDGSVYTGPLFEAKKHGQGKITYTDGRTLEGEFKNGKLWNGHGVMKFTNGDVFEGMWKNGRKFGEGTVTYPDGRTLQGEFKDGHLCNGRGVLKLKHCVQEGTWVNGKMSGPGSVVFNSHNSEHTLKGTFRAGRILSGEGTFVTSDNTLYTGIWVGGLLAQGKILHADGRVLDGEFKKGKIHTGSGILQLRDGAVYEGAWVEGRWEGQGKLVHATGQCWEGEFRGGRMYTGSGVASGLDGVYEGAWLNGMKHGYGRENWFDGSVYEGEFDTGRRHGQGKLTRHECIAEGEFRDGRIYNGTGVVVLQDGERYNVTWVNGQSDYVETQRDA